MAEDSKKLVTFLATDRAKKRPKKTTTIAGPGGSITRTTGAPRDATAARPRGPVRRDQGEDLNLDNPLGPAQVARVMGGQPWDSEYDRTPLGGPPSPRTEQLGADLNRQPWDGIRDLEPMADARTPLGRQQRREPRL